MERKIIIPVPLPILPDENVPVTPVAPPGGEPIPPFEPPMQMPSCGMLAAAYIPMQVWENIYPTEEGFERATIFKDLDKPFLGGGVK